MGGSLTDPQVNMTTYDFLQSNSLQQFDTLLMLIDKAGLKDIINQQGVTFFPPDDRAIFSYLNERTVEKQRVDPNAKYTLDSLLNNDIQKVTDSMKMYIINDLLSYDRLTENGTKFPTALAGDTAVVSFEETLDPNLGYTVTVSSTPRLVYFTHLFQSLPEPFVAEDIPKDIGTRNRIRTSGIQTTTGIVHVPVPHTLFFYEAD